MPPRGQVDFGAKPLQLQVPSLAGGALDPELLLEEFEGEPELAPLDAPTGRLAQPVGSNQGSFRLANRPFLGGKRRRREQGDPWMEGCQNGRESHEAAR